MNENEYLKGKQNWLIRAYFYCSNGLAILNEFRNMLLGILAIYFALKWNNYWLLLVMIIPSIIILTLVGYVVVHKVAKVKEWLTMRFGTHFGIKAYDYNEDNNKLLKEIRDLLRNNKR